MTEEIPPDNNPERKQEPFDVSKFVRKPQDAPQTFRYPEHGTSLLLPENGCARMIISMLDPSTGEPIEHGFDFGSVTDAVGIFNLLSSLSNESGYKVVYDPDNLATPKEKNTINVGISTLNGNMLPHLNVADTVYREIDEQNGYAPLKIPTRHNFRMVAIFGDGKIIIAEADDLESMKVGIKRQERGMTRAMQRKVKFVECTKFAEVAGNRYNGIVKFSVFGRSGNRVPLSGEEGGDMVEVENS